MSLRVIACFLFVFGFVFYTRRNWFASLCAAIVLMSVLEHPDMPRAIFGIQGLNLWNILMLSVIVAWWRSRSQEGVPWDMPDYMRLVCICYLFAIVVAFIRMAIDYQALEPYGFSLASLTNEELINCVKWLIPGLLLYDACRTRRKVRIALFVILLFYLLLAVQVIRYMPLSNVTSNGTELAKKAAKLLRLNMGFYRTELSMMLAGGSWAILSSLALVQKKKLKLALVAAAMGVSLGQALTGGRAGYVTWGVTGLIIALVRWRWLLPYLGLTVIGICLFLPSVRDRMLQGFGGTQEGIVTDANEYTITAGRTLAWSYVIPMIWKSPVLGYGREAMIRTGVTQRIIEESHGEEEMIGHPHNAYLQILLDGGCISFLLVMPFYAIVLIQSLRLLFDRGDVLYGAAGGVAAAQILALLVASFAAQSFWPREAQVALFASIGVMLRVYVERKRSIESGEPLFGEEDNERFTNFADELHLADNPIETTPFGASEKGSTR